MPRCGISIWTKLRCRIQGHPGPDPHVMESVNGDEWYSLCVRCGARLDQHYRPRYVEIQNDATGTVSRLKPHDAITLEKGGTLTVLGIGGGRADAGKEGP